MVNPRGAVTLSRHWAYAYQDGSVPTFMADVNGAYSLQLRARLAFADRAYPEQRDSVSELKLTVSPDGKVGAASCSATPFDGSLAALSLVVLALWRRGPARRGVRTQEGDESTS